uniref:Integrase catalytic domain-containing protein n=1 Tax=Seriola dumerili TaxID=41447 RepID=A0A3B4UTM8_SERDU
LRTDTSWQFAAEDLRQFCKSYGITHHTSSPHTPHCNGEEERVVQTVKRLWNKAPALLDYRTTPLESCKFFSPAQLLMGRKLRNRLPTGQQLFIPKAYNSFKITHLLDRSKAFQMFYYVNSRASKHRLPLTPGEEVRVEPYPGSTRWSRKTREVWKGMRTITGYKEKNSQGTLGDVDKANEFNLFYNRFNTASPVPSPTASAAASPAASPPQPDTAAATPSTRGSSILSFTAEEVRAELNQLRPG